MSDLNSYYLQIYVPKDLALKRGHFLYGHTKLLMDSAVYAKLTDTFLRKEVVDAILTTPASNSCVHFDDILPKYVWFNLPAHITCASTSIDDILVGIDNYVERIKEGRLEYAKSLALKEKQSTSFCSKLFHKLKRGQHE